MKRELGVVREFSHQEGYGRIESDAAGDLITSDHIKESRDFYAGFLGFQIGMDMGSVITFVSPSNPTAQITLVRGDESASVHPQMTIEVDNVDQAHTNAVERGLKIVYPLTDEPWGISRFFVADPNGVVINVMSHTEHERAR